MNHEMGQFPSFHDIFWHFHNTIITQFLWSFLGWLTAEWTNLWSYTGHCSQHCDHWAAMFVAWNNVQTIHRTVYLPCPPPEAAWRNHDHQHFSWWCPLYVVVIFPIFAAPPGGHHGQCVESGADTICRWQPGSGQSGDITADKLGL